jgi:hypothetical protein
MWLKQMSQFTAVLISISFSSWRHSSIRELGSSAVLFGTFIQESGRYPWVGDQSVSRPNTTQWIQNMSGFQTHNPIRCALYAAQSTYFWMKYRLVWSQHVIPYNCGTKWRISWNSVRISCHWKPSYPCSFQFIPPVIHTTMAVGRTSEMGVILAPFETGSWNLVRWYSCILEERDFLLTFFVCGI